MIAIHIEKVRFVHNKYFLKIEKQREAALKGLRTLKKSRIQLSSQEEIYLDSIINLYENKEILLSNPKDIKDIKTLINSLPPCSRKPRRLKPFKKILIEILNYDGLRKSFYPKYFNQLGIKACVYCNSALTISVEKSSNTYSARFDVDHFEPKDEFPYLSIFLFNLYPTCAPCNRRKSKSTGVDFKLYSDDRNLTNTSEYKFSLDNGAKSKYMITKDLNDLNFKFTPISNSLQNNFRIEEIYSTQKDVIEELIVKQAMYDDYNKKSLQNSFSKLSLRPDLYLRTLVGNYIKESDIHKRPMAKFMQDIARDLGIID